MKPKGILIPPYNDNLPFLIAGNKKFLKALEEAVGEAREFGVSEVHFRSGKKERRLIIKVENAEEPFIYSNCEANSRQTCEEARKKQVEILKDYERKSTIATSITLIFLFLIKENAKKFWELDKVFDRLLRIVWTGSFKTLEDIEKELFRGIEPLGLSLPSGIKNLLTSPKELKEVLRELEKRAKEENQPLGNYLIEVEDTDEGVKTIIKRK